MRNSSERRDGWFPKRRSHAQSQRAPALFAALIVLASAAASVAFPSATGVTAPSGNGGSVDSVVWFEQSDPAQALRDLEAGSMDLYTLPIRNPAVIENARSNPDLATRDEYAALLDLFLNPVPVYQNATLNPFLFRPIREAMNYLVDRDYIVNVVLGGVGLPQTSPWNSRTPEFARDARFFLELERNYSYDPQRARDIVNASMTEAGATLENGVWTWNGSPVTVTFIIRIEDRRLDIGNYVADQVETLGFRVERRYKTASEAFSIVYFGPPDIGAWHLYTEGFGITRLNAWADDDLWGIYTAAEGSAIWDFYPGEPELNDVATRLKDRDYTTGAERQALIRRGAELALGNSVRSWLAVGSGIYVSSKRVTALAQDLATGPWSLFSVRTARFADPGGVFKVGQAVHLNSPYQPWRGFSWLYDRLIAQAFTDPGVGFHPHTGKAIPVRANFTVTTAGPSGQLDVPPDALVYNATTDVWESVPAGSSAISNVLFNYTFGPWHHGVPMTMDDVLYEMALLARRDRGDIAARDRDAVLSEQRLWMNSFKGLRVVDETHLEVYLDYWHVDPAVIAQRASVFPATPWEASELGMATVLADETRVSPVTARQEGREVLDLTRGQSLTYLDGRLPVLTDANHRPPGADTYPGDGITPDEASTRWAALGGWRADHGTYYVSNGPFYLAEVNTGLRQLVLNNFASYPFPSDYWDHFLTPSIPEVAVASVPFVQIGAPAQFDVTTTLGGQPYDDVVVEYLISNVTGTVALRGSASHGDIGSWPILLSASETATLAPGSYTLEAVAVGVDAAVPVVASSTFTATSADATPPSSTVFPIGRACSNAAQVPFDVTATAVDAESEVASVELFYAHSPDRATWSPPASLGSRTGPFEWTFSPALLSGDGWYRVTSIATDIYGNVESLAGKPNGDAEFRVDTGLPFVVGTLPVPGESDVETTSTLRITFSEAMDIAAPFHLVLTPDVPDASLSWSANQTTVTVLHGPFATDTAYTATLDQASDTCGNPIGLAFSWGWRTRAPADTTAPSSSASPLATYWQRSAPVTISATATDDISGVAEVALYVSFSFDGASWTSSALAATLTSEPFIFSYDPAFGDGRYRFWTVATDHAGNAEPWSGKPATGEVEVGFDSHRPRLIGFSPAATGFDVPISPGTIRVTFSEPVDRAAAEAAFRIQPATPGTFSWENNTLVFTPAAPLQGGTRYEVRILAGVPDRAGNVLAEDFVWTFRTEGPSGVGVLLGPLGLALAVVAGVGAGVAAALLIKRGRARKRSDGGYVPESRVSRKP